MNGDNQYIFEDNGKKNSNVPKHYCGLSSLLKIDICQF